MWVREWRRGVLIAREEGTMNEVIVGMVVSDMAMTCHEAIPAGEEVYTGVESDWYFYRAIRAVDGVCVGVGVNKATAERFVMAISDEDAGLHVLSNEEGLYL